MEPFVCPFIQECDPGSAGAPEGNLFYFSYPNNMEKRVAVSGGKFKNLETCYYTITLPPTDAYLDDMANGRQGWDWQLDVNVTRLVGATAVLHNATFFDPLYGMYIAQDRLDVQLDPITGHANYSYNFTVEKEDFAGVDTLMPNIVYLVFTANEGYTGISSFMAELGIRPFNKTEKEPEKELETPYILPPPLVLNRNLTYNERVTFFAVCFAIFCWCCCCLSNCCTKCKNWV